MATPPVFLPGESPWTGEPGGLQSMVSQRVGHKGLSTAQHSHAVVKEAWDLSLGISISHRLSDLGQVRCLLRASDLTHVK